MIRDKLNKIKYRTKRLAIEGSKLFYDAVIYQGMHHIPTLPPFVVVETTNLCNFRCIMCDHISMVRKKIHMDISTYKKIIDDMASTGLKRLGLSRFGEPLLHPSITEMIRYSKGKGIKRVTMSSNGALLTEKLSEDIILSGLDDLSFSIDGSTKETFERIRVGGNFDKVVYNIERFLMIRKKLGANKPLVRINAVLMEENREEFSEIVKKWRPIADGVRVSPMASYGEIRAHSTIGDFRNDKKIRPCPQLWTRLVVLSNGEVTVCCADYEGKLSVGNIKNHNIKELWQSNGIKKIRDINFRRSFDELPICKSCVGISKDWIKIVKNTLLKYDGAWSGDIDV